MEWCPQTIPLLALRPPPRLLLQLMLTKIGYSLNTVLEMTKFGSMNWTFVGKSSRIFLICNTDMCEEEENVTNKDK